MKSPLVKEILDNSSVLPLHINIPDCFILEFFFTYKKNETRKHLKNLVQYKIIWK